MVLIRSRNDMQCNHSSKACAVPPVLIVLNGKICSSINGSFPFSRRLHQLNSLKWIVDTLASGEQKRKGEATSITMKIRVIGCFVA